MKTYIKHTLILSCADIHQIIRELGFNKVMDDLIQHLEKALLSFDPKQTIIPIRSGFHYYQPHTGLVEWMPLMNQGKEVSIKVVGYHPENPDVYALPTILSTISSYDVHTGHLSGLMDGVLPTALRTGASSAVASKLLAHPESQTLGLIGCGAQSITQLHAISRVFDIQKVLIYDIDPKSVFSFRERSSVIDLNIEIIPAEMYEVVEESDILCTATSIEVGTEPLFNDVETKNHLHINAVGSDFPGKTELPLGLLMQSFVCPDFRAQAVVEGECQQIPEEHIAPDWVTVIQDQDTYAHIKQAKSVFDSTGWALEDQVVMNLFMQYALDLGIGQQIEIESIPEDAKNPYEFLAEFVAK